jgi:hypothetical protein
MLRPAHAGMPRRPRMAALVDARLRKRAHHLRRVRADAGRRLDFFAAGVFLDRTLSGSASLPVSRFHSSKVSGLILPSTRSCANLRRWALLLNGMVPAPDQV